jgi:hypothetical protein
MQPKVCTICLRPFPATREHFSRSAAHKDGLNPACKPCYNAKLREWRQANPEKARAIGARYRGKDPTCYRERAKRRSRNYYQTHKAEISQRWKAKYRRNHAAMRAYALAYWHTHKPIFQRASQKYRATHLARIQERERQSRPQKRLHWQTYYTRKKNLPATFTDADWQFALHYWQGCTVCGAQDGLLHRLAMDHWIPLASPDCPGTVRWNILPLCHGLYGCNSTKSQRDPWEWLQERLGKRGAARKRRAIQTYFALVRQGGGSWLTHPD